MDSNSKRQATVLLAAIALSFGLFMVWPSLDLTVSGYFHDPVLGFSLVDDGWPNSVRLAIWQMSEAMLATAVAACMAGLVTGQPVLGLPRRLWTFIALYYLLVPGLLVDVILKRVWGRARPADVTEFGGALRFTPPHEISGQCLHNCSFVAGEVSGAVALAVCLALILQLVRDRISPAAYRIGLAVILALPMIATAQRIAAGRHFLSDAIFATLFTLLAAVALRAWLLPARAR